MKIPWQINIEIRMTPEEADELASRLDADKHTLLLDALTEAVADFKRQGYASGRLVLGLGGERL